MHTFKVRYYIYQKSRQESPIDQGLRDAPQRCYTLHKIAAHWRRLRRSDHLSTRQYARIVKAWGTANGPDPAMYGTHTTRRTKASLIYRRTKNLRAVQLLLGHTKLESTIRYRGIAVDDAWKMAEQTEVCPCIATVETRSSLSADSVEKVAS
jgi:integrase